MPYPSTISAISNPAPTDRLNNPSHSGVENAQASAIGEIETFVGTLSSTQGTLIYDIRSSNSNGGGHVQTANKGGTGQTSFNNGDILIAQSSSVLSKLAVSSVQGYALITDSTANLGVKWGVPNNNPTVRTYTRASITGTSSLVALWTKPSTIAYAVVEVVGGGAGGGGTSTNGDSCGGGGAGGYSRKVIAASSLPATASIILGSAGQGGDGTGATGSDGTVTHFGSVMSANGGTGGLRGSSGGDGGGGGTATGGDVNVKGGGGGAGGTSAPSGTGGSNPLGFGGYGRGSDSGGIDAGGYGGGGSGAKSSGSNRAGGNGTHGTVIIYEY